MSSGNQHLDMAMQTMTDPLYAQYRLENSLAKLISLGPTSQLQWAKDNPKKHLDRFQHFIFHYLAVEYGLSHLASLSVTDRRYFAYLGIVYGRALMYKEFHEKHSANFEKDLERAINSYVNLSIKIPSRVLGIAKDFIIHRILLTYLSRYHEMLSHTKHHYERKVVYYSKEDLERKGDFWAYEIKLHDDLKLVQVAVPYGNSEARSVLESKIRAELHGIFPTGTY